MKHRHICFAALLAAVLLGHSCVPKEKPEIHFGQQTSIVSDYSGILTAISDMSKSISYKLKLIEDAVDSQTLSLEQKLNILNSAVENGVLTTREMAGKIVESINAMNATMDEKLAALAELISSGTAELSSKLALIQEGVEAGFIDNKNAIDFVKDALASLEGTMEERLAAIEAVVSDASAGLAAKLLLIEAAVKQGFVDNASAIGLVKDAVESLEGTLEDMLADIEEAVDDQTAELSSKLLLIDAAVNQGFIDNVKAIGLVKDAVAAMGEGIEEKLVSIDSAIVRSGAKLSSKLALIQASLDTGFVHNEKAIVLVRDAVDALDGTVDARLDAVEDAILANTAGIGPKLTAIETAVKNGFAADSVALRLIEKAIQDLDGTAEEKLDAIKKAITDGFATDASLLKLIEEAINNIEIVISTPAGPDDYVDEYGANRGPGITIAGITWAPVNCGYHPKNFRYGKLYQWGRKDGHGSGDYIIDGVTYIESEPLLVKGPISGLNADPGTFYYDTWYYYTGSGSPRYANWTSTDISNLWNFTENDANPKKTNFDPCPDGWRVPTSSELSALVASGLSANQSLGEHGSTKDLKGYVLGSGENTLFLPTAGLREFQGDFGSRIHRGVYWSGTPAANDRARALNLSYNNDITGVQQHGEVTSRFRTFGASVRCVKLREGEEMVKFPDPDDYVDEYGTNHGKGVTLSGVTFAPVNCGYHPELFRYGKLYQWGRKDGHGYGDYREGDTFEDPIFFESKPEKANGPITSNNPVSNYFYAVEYTPYDWLKPSDKTLWNAGTEVDPVKTAYDPCPEGWRVPTWTELSKLQRNIPVEGTLAGTHGTTTGLSGVIFGEDQNLLFLPAAGERDDNYTTRKQRTEGGCYWTSSLFNNALGGDTHQYALLIYSYTDSVYGYTSGVGTMGYSRAAGISVRCVLIDPTD